MDDGMSIEKTALDDRIDASALGCGVAHPASNAAWIWIDDGGHTTRFLEFRLEFSVEEPQSLRFHASADQRFQLSLDGEVIGYGPDRSDLENWRVSSYELALEPGTHCFTTQVWWIAEHLTSARTDPSYANDSVQNLPANPPMAQMSWSGGFLFAADGELALMLNSGQGAWQVWDRTPAVSMVGKSGLGYHDIGGQFHIDMSAWNSSVDLIEPVVVLPPDEPNPHGVIRPGRQLASHILPEQRRERFAGGAFRNVELQLPVTIPANTERTLLWDFETYRCGYPDLMWSGGVGASVEAEWAESLYQDDGAGDVDAFSPKGRRDEVDGKVWHGFGDTFICSGADQEVSPGLWWRSGRYLRVRIRTADDPLVLERVAILTTRYPLDHACQWESSDPEWDALFPLFFQGLEMCAHETWVDCPYYEQLMYTGDTRLHALNNYAAYHDDRLSRSALELFDASRRGSPDGMVAERYPSGWRQESATYAMIWIWMVRDFMLWRDDVDFVRERQTGVRQLLENLLAMRQSNGLLGNVPGWPFIDWVDAWFEGCGPGVREGDSSIVNLHFILSLQAAAEIETAVGEACLADRYRRIASDMMAIVLDRYWDLAQNALLDSPEIPMLSEHAQVLALLTGLLDPTKGKGCLDVLRSGMCEAECSIYFSFYLLEAFQRYHLAEPFFKKLEFWRGLPGRGFVSLPEAPEPTRSDCHGWGAHPLFHSLASIAGIRPAAPGFKKVRITPMPGPLKNISLTMPHPDGKIAFAFNVADGKTRFDITLPTGITGELIWNGKTFDLKNNKTIEV